MNNIRNDFPMRPNNPMMGYIPQPMQQPQPQMQPQQTQQTYGITWVQGSGAAKSYPLAPNITMPLWDSEEQIIYLKSTDAQGKPSIKVLRYEIEELPEENNSNYLTKNEFKSFMDQYLNEIKKEIGYGKPVIQSNDATAKSEPNGSESAIPAFQ